MSTLFLNTPCHYSTPPKYLSTIVFSLLQLCLLSRSAPLPATHSIRTNMAVRLILLSIQFKINDALRNQCDILVFPLTTPMRLINFLYIRLKSLAFADLSPSLFLFIVRRCHPLRDAVEELVKIKQRGKTRSKRYYKPQNNENYSLIV